MKLKYVRTPKSNKLSAASAAIVAKELRKLERKHSVITPQVVVEAARDPVSPLHQHFEWNTAKAAEKYRIWQARFLICSVYMVDEDSKCQEPIRAFVNISPDEDDDFIADRGYVATGTLNGRQSYQMQVLDYAKSLLLHWRKKFGAYREFFGVVEEIDRLK